MPYVYKYVNRETDCVEYVGIIKKDSNFPKRFNQHKRDDWWKFGKYDIYYSYVESQTDAEALEGHFIAEYGSADFNNVAKAQWGLCSFAPNISWTKYEDEISLSLRKGQAAIEKRWQLASAKLESLNIELERLQCESDRIRMEFLDCMKKTERLKRASIRQWFRSTFEIVWLPYKGKCATTEQLYRSYCDYVETLSDVEDRPFGGFLNFDEIYDFEDANEFWETMLEIHEYRNVIRGNTMYALMYRDEFQKLICEEAREYI